MKKRAFTLTELLVVVVIIGVLSAVVLPKFTKVLQTRKTTEAENVMAAVRNEQEARCMVGRNYVGQNEIGKLASLPKATSKNYTYTLDAQGITATAKDGNYTLQIPSYTDGRICCSGAGCAGLNKDYPACNDTFLAAIDQSPCQAPIPEEPEPEPEPEEPQPTPCDKTEYWEQCPAGQTGQIHYTVNEQCEYVKDESGCTQRTACSIPWTEAEKNDCRCDEHQDVEKDCPDGFTGKQTRTETCNTLTGKYEYGNWDSSACEASTKQCTGEDTQRCGCGLKGTQTRTCDTSTGEWSAWGKCSVDPTPSKTTEEENCTFTTTYFYSYMSDMPSGSVTTGNPVTGKRTRTFNTSTCTWGTWGRCVANAYVSLGPFTKSNNKHYCRQGDWSHCNGGQGLNTPCNWPQSGGLSGPYCPSPFGDGCYIYQCQQLIQ